MLSLGVVPIQAAMWLIRVVVQIGLVVTLSGLDGSNDRTDGQFRRPPICSGAL